jgi:hypothetical protein
VPAAADSRAYVGRLLEAYAGNAPDHPMTAVLSEAMAPPPRSGRRGGARGRRD